MATSAGVVYAELILDTSKYEQGLKKAKENTDSFTKKMSKVGEGMKKVGDKLTKYVTTPIVGAGLAATKLGMDFEAQMSRVQAIAGATGEDLQKLTEVALQLGADTAFSATEVAEAMENLASAGFSVNEIIAAIPGNLDLAAASGTKLATATDIAASILRGFQLEASEAGRVADVLAKAANRTNAQVEDMGESMKYIAPVAYAMGMSLEETAAAVGILADAGIKGSQAGTTLRSALTRLTKPTKQMKEVMNKLGLEFFDAQGNMKSLAEIIAELEEGTKGLTQEQKNQAIATLFGQEALSGMLVLIEQGPEKLRSLTKEFENSAGAAKEAADIMMNNTKGSVEEMMGALETAGIKIFKIVAPAITDLAKKVGELADKFSALPEETQKNIIQLATFAALSGPVLKFTGNLTGGIAKAVDWFNKLSGATQASTTVVASLGNAAAIGTGKVTGLGLAAKAGAILMNPWTIGLAAAGTAAYGLYKYLQQDTIPAVDLFADKIEYTTTTIEDGASRTEVAVEKTVTKISEATKEAVGAYLQLDEEAKKHLESLYINSTAITEDIKTELESKYSEMADNILQAVSERRKEDLDNLSEFFNESKAITDKEQQDIYYSTMKYYEDLQYDTQRHQDRIIEILENAAKEKRKLTEEEMNEIGKIQSKMKENAVRILSEQEIESNIILERMKEYDKRITAEQASEHIKQVNRARDEAVKAANEEYEERLRLIIRLRDEAGAISAEQADKLIQEAQRQKNETIKAAEDTRLEAINKMRDLCDNLDDMVDTTTGNVLTRWDKIKRWWSGWKPETKVAKVTTIYEEIDNRRIQKVVARPYARGTNFHPGGLALVGEEGPELIELPRGSKVYTANRTKDILGKRSGDIIQHIHIHSPTPLSPSEIARKNLQVSRQLAMEWGL